MKYNGTVFKNYLATKTDLEAIEEGLKTVWKPELNFVFRKKGLIASTVIVSYDSKYIYLWIPLREKPGQYRFRKILHNTTIPPEHHRGWSAGVWEKMEQLLPASIRKASKFAIPRIGGGLLKPFVTLQKDMGLEINPYTTKESYLATIVHEFGHIYWQQHKLWWYSDKKENLRYLRLARLLYAHPNVNVPQIPFYLPNIHAVGEIYAFCAEYTAGTLFWPTHCKNCDKFIQWRLKNLLDVEAKTNLDRVDSVLEPTKYPHDFSFVFGKIVLTRYPQLWPVILTRRPSLVD